MHNFLRSFLNNDGFQGGVSALRRLLPIFLSVIMIGVIISWTLPLVGLIINSFRPSTLAIGSGWWTVFQDPQFTLDNYRVALSDGMIFTGFKNSILITIPTTFLVVAVASGAAFALTWTDMPGRKWMYAFLVGMLFVPQQITLYPTLIILQKIKLANSFPGVWLSHMSASMAFGVFLMGSFISQIPRELRDAAEIDGASTWDLLVKVVLPLSKPAMASLATFNFLWVWNDLLRALVIIPDPAIRPLTAVLANVAGGYGEYVTVQSAAAIMLMLPPLAVFLMAQGAFVRGVLAGAVKG
jgi:alpha-glucoside transport system permease protein